MMIEYKYNVVVFRSKLLSETGFQLMKYMWTQRKNRFLFIMKQTDCFHDQDDIFFQDHWQPDAFISEFYLCQTRYIYNVSCCIHRNDDIMTWIRFLYYM